MKKILLALALLISYVSQAQVAGDTLTLRSFNNSKFVTNGNHQITAQNIQDFNNGFLSLAFLPLTADYLITTNGSVITAVPRLGSSYPLYSGSVASTVINNAIIALTSGRTILVMPGSYTITASIIDNGVSGINFVFSAGAKFVAANSLNNPVIYLTTVNNWKIVNPEIDGNASNQSSPTDGLHSNGIFIHASNNTTVESPNIYNCRTTGVYIDGVSASSGVKNGLVHDCGWNGITLGEGFTGVNLFAINNEVYNASDVGIASYGYHSRILSNYVHDITGSTGFNSARWGIASETGGGSGTGGSATIVNNTIRTCNVGINLAVNCDSNFVSGNTINNWDSSGTYMPAIWAFSNYNTIENNVTTKNFSKGIGITLGGSAAGNFVSGNKHVGTGAGVNLDQTASTNTVSNNWSNCTNGSGVYINSSSCVGNKILFNDWSQSNSDITDNGTGTIYGSNIYKDGLVHLTNKAGTTTLVSGTKAITIAGLTTSSIAFVQITTQAGTSTTVYEYKAVCTSNTLTITAITTAGATVTTDTSVLNYFIIN